MPRRAFLLALMACIGAVVFAQAEDPQWYLGKPIKDFMFTGLRTISSAELRPVVRPYIGKAFTIDLYEEVRQKLLALEYFDLADATARPGDEGRASVVIDFEMKERPTVAAVEVAGNVGVRTPAILEKILIKKGDMASEPLVDVDVQTIRSLYLEKGYTKAEVAGRMDKDEAQNTVTVVFQITEGTQTKTRDILFSGNTFASESTLRRLMKTRKQSLLSSGDFQESVLETDKQLIQGYYGKNGFIDAKVVKVEQNVVDDPETGKSFRDITLYIEEGQQFTLGGVEFEGAELYDAARLQEAMRLKTGKPINMEQLRAALARVVQGLYWNDGYLDTVFAPEEKRDATTNVVSYVVHVEESDRVHIENIVLSGNERTKDHVILRELPFEEGDVYSWSQIGLGYQNLLNLGYFASVIPDFAQGSTKGLRDLVITVEEQSTAAFNFGFTVSGSADAPIVGKIGWSETNFLGNGQAISVDAEISGTTQSLSLSFREPYLFGRKWTGAVSLAVSHGRVTGVPQDVLGPVFSDLDYESGIAVPDPYVGYWVDGDTGAPYDFTRGGTVTPPTTLAELLAVVEEYDLVTDYEYANSVIPDGYTMAYDKTAFSLGVSTGVRRQTPAGLTFRVDPYLSSSLEYKSYDPTVYRPYRQEDRFGLESWLVVDKLGIALALDKRDLINNPQSGFYLLENFVSVGGVLGGWKHFFKTTTTAEAYLPLITAEVNENYTFRLVLGVHSSIAFVLPQWHYDTEIAGWTWSTVAETADKLYIDGRSNARGWLNVSLPGTALWESGVELRMPISEQLLWWSFFFDAAAKWTEPAGIAAMNIEDFYFSFGAGFRFTHSQFPIRLYLAKGFRIEDGAVNWKMGDLDLGAFSLDFVISIGTLGF